MTHQNNQTNGASLEDCHTNFFALTELYGIKWRKLVWGESGNNAGAGETDGAGPLADPVISSYVRCLAGDILCVWRRVAATSPAPPQDLYELSIPPPPTPPPLSLRAAKELWIFWYGEEPDLSGMVAPELLASQGEQGSWDSGLSYECRSLLFKALHNLIERCLLSRDFMRLGKWFVLPYDGDDDDIDKSSCHLSLSFAFFLHGESTVCASLDVRQHPPVRTLTSRRLARAASLHPPDHPDAKVILAPYGLEGTLTGRERNDTNPTTGRLLDDWRHLFPLEQGCNRAVEVMCGGVSMWYPASYVLWAASEHPAPPAPPDPAPPSRAAALAQHAARALTCPRPHQQMDICNGDDKGEGEFLDPTRKTPCTCAKWRRARRGRPAPFHRRELRAHAAHATRTSAGACSPNSCGGGSPPTPPAGPAAASPATHPHGTHTQSASCVPPALHTPAPTPDPLAPPTPAAPPNAARLYTQGGESPAGAEQSPPALLRRPALPPPARRPDPLENEHALSMLYDYTSVHAWLDHPVKRFKADEPRWSDELCAGGGDHTDLYAGHDHTKMAAVPDPPEHKDRGELAEDKEYKNLFTSDGLCPTLKDLDQIFDNSDDAASGDETVRLLQVQTPPDSNKSADECRTTGLAGGGRALRPEELSKMFPTPPSLEPHAHPSPGWSLGEDQPTGSPQPDPIDDWSFVFKPPAVCKYVGSSKYAPLPVLPSQQLPPLAVSVVYRPRRGALPAPPPRPAAPSPALSAPPPPAPPARAERPPASAPAPRACPLMLNVLLADTVLNVFRDHNFDSCTLCVCNAEPNVVGNIRGADAATYLPPPSPDDELPPDDSVRCTCGFSAVLNRRLAHGAGLFYEDEMEITGAADDPAGDKPARPLVDIAAPILEACLAPGGPGAALAREAGRAAAASEQNQLQTRVPELLDGCHATSLALAAACRRARPISARLHNWPYTNARRPRSSRDVVKLMRRLRPLLQDAIQKRCCGARMWDGVSGPLTWRQFHRLAGRGNDDLCEPQPVPYVLVGHERDWIALSPYALRHWEKKALEPYSYARDVAYVVLAPSSPTLTQPLRAFFRELSAVYEGCRLGRHAPLTRIAPEGLLRAEPVSSSGADPWLPDPPVGSLGACLRSYADKLRTKLAPQLSSLTLDHTLFDDNVRAAPSPMRPPSTPDHPATPSSQSDQENDVPPPPAGAPQPSGWEQTERGAPLLVVYLVEPVHGHVQPAPALHALLALAARLNTHAGTLVKIISLDGIWSGLGPGELRALAFSVFSGARRSLTHTAVGKSLTGFGTAADASLLLNAKDEKNRAPYPLYSPAWVLAPARGRDVAESWGQPSGADCAVLFLSYCLSHDQRHLLAAATDGRGELLDTVLVDVHVPARSRRRRHAQARRHGLNKLMDFILGVMSQSAQPWRLVVGRVGRIGHGELKGWSWLLSRKNLNRASNVLRELCASCSVLYPQGAPCILSACLVSTEPDSRLRLMADRFTPDERFSQASIASHLHTPRDATATHILVFPTSATTQSTQLPFEAPLASSDGDDYFLGVDMGEEDMGEDNMTDLLIGDMFNNMWAGSSPRRAEDEARAPAADERAGSVLQQPLALGYLVSTAPLTNMPAWWWAGCAHLKGACPAFLKTALHLHAGTLQSNDDFTLTQHHTNHQHPLDSTTTTDVLRYVLEGYNALSWLSLDNSTHDRVSCLPIHVQVLMQLYHTAVALD